MIKNRFTYLEKCTVDFFKRRINLLPKIDNNISLGINLAAGMGLSIGFGIFAESRWDISPWGILAGCAFGLFYCGYEIFKCLRKINKD